MMGIIKTKSLPLIKKLGGRGAALLLGLVMAVPAFAATRDNGCGNPDNVYINPELALCSVHAYNIGRTNNPNSSSADSQIMRDVVALKTTVMMQQMYKQYSFLEATLNRMKTQLKREILTTQAEAAGAPSSDSSSGYSASTGDRNIYLAGTTNCNNMATTAEVYSCLRNNYNLIYNMSNGGTNLTIELRRQLANDYNVMQSNVSGVAGMTVPTVSIDGQNFDCTAFANINSRDKFQACLNALNTGIRSATNLLQNQQRNNQQRPD